MDLKEYKVQPVLQRAPFEANKGGGDDVFTEPQLIINDPAIMQKQAENREGVSNWC